VSAETVQALAAAAASPANGSKVDTNLNGKWRASARSGDYKDDIVQFSFLAGNYEILKEYGPASIGPLAKGTYATDAKGNVFLKTTHLHDRNKWVTIDEVKREWKSRGASDAVIKQELTKYWVDTLLVYSITQGSVLQLYRDGDTYTYLKQ